MLKKGILLFLMIIIGASVTSCSKRSVKVNNSSMPTVTIATATVTPEKENSTPTPETSVQKNFIFPAEGIRPVAVMIDNEGVKSLPQGGIYKAQLVYEITVEGGETRLMPVFWGADPELIGPVRSSRHYFLDYAMEHDAIYVHYGWSPMAMSDISKFKINNINGVGYGGEVFWDLTKDKGNWQDSYTSMEKVNSFIKKAKYRTTTDKKHVFTYSTSETEIENGQKAEKIDLKYTSSYTSGYVYDSSTKLYQKFRKGKPHMERTDNTQLTVKNIIVQSIPNYRIKGDDKDRQELSNVGSGNGWFITCGKAIKIKWSKESRSAPTKYVDEKGNPIILNAGLTWIQIVPVSSKVIIE
jgi:hypothetical protein